VIFSQRPLAEARGRRVFVRHFVVKITIRQRTKTLKTAFYCFDNENVEKVNVGALVTPEEEPALH
jgi:hypothetical protein